MVNLHGACPLEGRPALPLLCAEALSVWGSNKEKEMKINFAWAVLTLFLGVNTFALEFGRYFSNDMVLQRDEPVKIWGLGKKDEKVTVTFAGQTRTASADTDGRWVVTLDPMVPNARGRNLKVTSPRTPRPATLSNVVVGDVFLFGRQAYVDVTLGSTEVGKTAAKTVKPSNDFRAIVIKTIPAKLPQADLNEKATTGWMKVGGASALNMSDAAFYLGADLVKDVGVPIGIVDVQMGQHFGIGWLSERAIAESATVNPNHKDMDWLPDRMREQAEDRDSGKAQKDLDEWWENDGKNRRRGGEKPLLGLHPLENPMYPSAGYNAVIYPLRDMVVKGVLLQLGNDYPFVAYRELEKQGLLVTKPGYDSGWQDNYMILKAGYRITAVTHPYIPDDWRRTLGDRDLPIGMILPPASDLDVYAAHNREIRELHRRTSEQKGAMGLIMPGNENIPSSGQPKNAKLLAKRCKQWVLGALEGKEGVTTTGPLFERLTAKLGKATLYFKKGTAHGLQDQGEALAMFETAGPEREFRPAKAKIDGSTIKLTSDGPITFVRYNWIYKPDQGLVNSAGLPAFPFNTDAEWQFAWIPPPQQPNLPKEYHTTADKWSKSDIAIINGQIANLSVGDSAPIPVKPGPLGIRAAPFGPNIIVTDVDHGTPADGKLQIGDVIYGVNGTVFEDGPDVPYDAQYFVLADAITHSESAEGEGKMVLSLRRGTKLMDVELQLKVMGTYSATTPYYCEKSQNIVEDAEAWFAKRYRPESGIPSEPKGMLYSDLLFMLASGNPEHQGLVRRAVYHIIERIEPKPVTDATVSKPWNSGHISMLLGEYFHATGDRKVLPDLKYQCDLSSASQLKPRSDTPASKEAAQSEMQVGGWRHNYPSNPQRWKSGYGLLPHAGMACVMGMQFAKEAGLDIDELALRRGIKHFNHKRAEYGFVLYAYGGLWREGPPTINPEAEANGKLWSMNGKLGMAASLFNTLDGYNDSVDICARHCIYGYNNTRHGHGGMFFNNFWTPIGAWAGGEQGFKHFMKGQRWWRELFRRSDGAFNQAGRGGVGVSYGLPYVAPKKRLRMVGAPRSAFGTNCPDYLKAALNAHQKRNYSLCESLIVKQLEENVTPPQDLPVVKHMLKSTRILRASIEHDLSFCEAMIEEGKFYYASLELPQLKGVVAKKNKRLKAIVQKLESEEGRALVARHRKACKGETQAVAAGRKAESTPAGKKEWVSLVAQKGKAGAKQSAPWQMKVVEHIDHAPSGWTEHSFNDHAWHTARLPISWTMYHTALFRSRFNIDDKDSIDALRVQGRFFQQQNVTVSLNGEVVAKVDQIGRGVGTTEVRLTDYALDLLHEGENLIALSSRHKRRWGPYRGTYKTAATVGFWFEGRKTK